MSESRAIATLLSTNTMKNIVILGAGPTGLALALYLIQQGLDKENLILVDMRHGEYTRSGEVVDETFDDLSALLGFKITPSYHSHIKDIERQLYAHAQANKLQFKKGNFDEFIPHEKKLRLSDGSHISADIVLDCTGTRRAGLTAINKINPYFTFETVDDYREVYTITVRCIVTNIEHSQKFLNILQHATKQDFFANRQMSQRQISKMQKLRLLGWESLDFPEIIPSSFENSHKVSIYMAAPKNLITDADKALWIQTLLDFWLDEDNAQLTLQHESKKYPQLIMNQRNIHSKPNISYFTVQVAHTYPFYYQGDNNLPLVFHVGDATMNTHFEMGNGIANCIKRIKILGESLHIKDGQLIKIDFQNYDNKMKAHIEEIKGWCSELKILNDDILREKTATLKKNYLYHLHNSTYNNVRGIASAALRDYNYQEGMELFHDSMIKFAKIKDSDKGIALHQMFGSPLETLKEIISSLRESIKLVPSGIDAEKIKAALLDVARCCKKLGTHLASLKNSAAKTYFQKSLELYLAYFSNHYPNETIILYSNLIILQKNNYSEVMRLSELALLELPYVTLADKDKYEAKIINQRILAILNKSDELVSSPAMKELLIEVERKLLPMLGKNSFAQANPIIAPLVQKLEELKATLPANPSNTNTDVSFSISTLK